jgi:hypothetical protein
MRVVRPLVLGMLLAACSTFGAKPPQPTYTADEMQALTYCVGLSNVALGVGAVKLKGGSAEDLKASYAQGEGQPMPIELTNELIDVVYTLEADSPYGYSQAYFIDCATHLADVPVERTAAATTCMSQANMALAAEMLKERGNPPETAVERLGQFKVTGTDKIVKRVYDVEVTRGQAETNEWESCMAPHHPAS